MKQAKYIFLLIILTSFFVVLIANAFESTSTNFEIHAGDVESIVGTATSSNFQNRSAGGQEATGFSTSTNRKIYSGILYWLFSKFTTDYTQIHYRWRNDDGSESSATWAAGEDTAISNLAKNTIRRLRFEISNEGWTRGGGIQFKIQYAQAVSCAGASYSDVPTDTSLAWQIADSTNLTDGAATTNVSPGLTDENASFVAGQVKDTSNLTSAITITSENFTEIEYSLKATNNAVDGGSYCFRLVKGDGSPLDSYSVFPQATIAPAATVSCSTNISSTSFPTLTSFSVSTASPNASTTISCSGTVAGCSLFVKDAGSGSNPGLWNSTSSVLIPSPNAAFSATSTLAAGTDGYGIQATTTASGLTLAARYNQSGNTVGGLSLTDLTLASSTADIASSTVNITHKAAVSASTLSGTYNDTITYSCVTN
jgi:hypothetical protein